MSFKNLSKKFIDVLATVGGILLLPLIWVLLHYYVGIGERFLPSPVRVIQAFFDIESHIIIDVGFTTLRFVLGSFLSIVVGILLGLLLYRSKTLYRLLAPSIQALRATPPIAAVPFFLLWFGFSEIGRYVLIIFGIGLNLSITTYQILDILPEKYRVLFHSFSLNPRRQIANFAIPLVLEEILPTVRFSLAISIGLVIVSELLGAEIGLGHLIQVARSTFALHTVVLATILLGIIMVLFDLLVVRLWSKLVYWKH